MLVTVRITAKNACYGVNYGKHCWFQQNSVLRVGVLHTGARPRSALGLSAQHARYGENYGKQCLFQHELRHKNVFFGESHAYYGEGYSL